MPEHPIAIYRQARGLSLRILSAAAKVHYVRLHHAEHGRRLAEPELVRVARVLGVSVDELQQREHVEATR
jgi:hypothetical protein